jgi:Domain of unknown function (DUF6647)
MKPSPAREANLPFLLLALVLSSVGPASAPALGQAPADPQPIAVSEDLAPVVRLLLEAIETLSSYRATGPLPSIFLLPQYRIEQKVCDAPCNVRAAYIPREGIYLSGNLDPVHDPLDRSALLHELVHYLQQGHAKFEGMDPCERERAKEQEAYAIQNAYLTTLGSPERVVFYDDFECESDSASEETGTRH